MLNQMGAGFVLRAYDAATPVIRKVGRGFQWLRGQTKRMAGGMNAALGSTATGFMALHAGLGLIKLAKEAGDAAGKFQQNLAGVGQIARATADEMVMLRRSAIDAALATKFSPDEAVEGLQTLAAQGLRASEAAEVLIPSLDLATGSLGQLGIAGAADAVVGSLKSMGVELSHAGEYTDKLLKITQMTNFQTRDFEVALGRATSSAKLYGQTFEDTLITLGLIRNMNIDASVASTSLREAWRRLASDQNAQQAVQQRGVDIFDKQTGKMRDLFGVMLELGAATKDLNDRERMRMVTIAFGVRGMAAYNAVLNATYTVMKDGTPIVLKGQSAINAMRYELSRAGETLTDVQKASLAAELGVKDLGEVLKTSTGVSRQYRDALLDTYEGQKQLIRGSWETLLVVIGEDFAKAMKPFAHAVFEAVAAMALFVNSMSPEAKQMIFKFVIALGALVTVGGGLMLLSGVLNMLGGSLVGFVFSIGKLLVIGVPLVMLLSGLGIGFGALGKAMNLFSKDGLNLTEIMTKVRLAASGMMSILSGEEFSEDLQKNLAQAENKGVVSFLKKFSRWMERLKALWAGLKEGFLSGVQALSQSSAFRTFQEKLQGIISIFTGPDAENSPEILKEWGDRGAEAGRTLARLGETAADMMSKLIDFGKMFVEFIANISAEDVKSAIVSFVDVFRTLGTVLAGIATAVKMIYLTIKLIVSAIIETIGGAVNALREVFGDETARKGGWFNAQNWEWTTGAFSQMASTGEDWNQRMLENAKRDAEAQASDRNWAAMRDMARRKVELEQWVNATPEQWKALTKGTGAEGNVAFGEAGAAMQRQYLDELATLNKRIEKLTGQPVKVYMDGQKIAEILGRQPSATGEDSLDDVAAVPAF